MVFQVWHGMGVAADAMQAGWRALQDGTKDLLPSGEVMQLEDVQNMAELCPAVVTLRDPQMYATAPFSPVLHSPVDFSHSGTHRCMQCTVLCTALCCGLAQALSELVLAPALRVTICHVNLAALTFTCAASQCSIACASLMGALSDLMLLYAWLLLHVATCCRCCNALHTVTYLMQVQLFSIPIYPKVHCSHEELQKLCCCRHK